MVETDTLTIDLTDIGHGGEAIGRADGQVVFAAYGIPGEKALVEGRQRKRDYIKGRVTEVLEPSPHRTTPPCADFGTCGGCQWQHIDYSFQLELKQRILREQLERIGKISSPYVPPTHPTPSPWHYRNHARFSVNRAGDLGFTRADDYQFLAIDYCHLMHPEINSALADFQGKCAGAHQVSIRYGVATGERLVQPPLHHLGIEMGSGQAHFTEVLFGYRFRVSGPSFFQVNTPQAERLVAAVRDRLGLKGDELLVDAYAGVGTFAALFAPYVKKVLAIEESSSAMKDAKVNCAPFRNVELALSKAEAALPELSERPDVVILDPPRVGCHRKVLEALLELAPPKIVYVSCDPATLARDLGILCRDGYRLKEALPVDMFPQTYHIESVSTLVLQGSGEV
ncbi:MAG: class I SAM-dependent RNA methyltransferase [Dehalococcoidia bacterium]